MEVAVTASRGGVSSERYEGGKTEFDGENDIPRELVDEVWQVEGEQRRKGVVRDDRREEGEGVDLVEKEVSIGKFRRS